MPHLHNGEPDLLPEAGVLVLLDLLAIGALNLVRGCKECRNERRDAIQRDEDGVCFRSKSAFLVKVNVER